MFYFYGRKKQLARHYPKPRYALIIEPFAGSAAYALHGEHWKRDVLLIERDSRVVDVWRWLIEEARPDDIRRLPTLKVGERSSEFLHIVHAATKMAFAYKTIKVTPVLERNWEISKRVMAAAVPKVKHWEIVCGDYTSAPDVEATWFIDPPYKGEPGMGYGFGSDQLDYDALAEWTRQRRGQVMACEGPNGDYLPFALLRTGMGVAGKRNAEVIWFNDAEAMAGWRAAGEQLTLGGNGSEVVALDPRGLSRRAKKTPSVALESGRVDL